MKHFYGFDKFGLVLGFCVIAIGSFVHYLVMVLGGMIVFASILANVVECNSVKKNYQPELERDSYVQKVTG